MKADRKDQGAWLKQAREDKGISLAEAEQATRIKASYLAALETSDWAALPSEVQARGFLRNYATFLGLDPDAGPSGVAATTSPQEERAALQAVDGVASSSVPTTQDGTIFKPRDISLSGFSRSSTDILMTVGVLLLVVAIAVAGVWLIRRGFGSGDRSGTAATPVSEAPVATLTPLAGGQITPIASGVQTPGLPPPTPTFAVSADNVQLVLEAAEHVWGRVTVDGAVVFEGILVPSDPRTWQGSRYVMVETGNGAGLRATVNGQPQGPLGERGQIVARAWSPSGPVAPVATPAPAPPTATLAPTSESPTEQPAEGP